MQFYKYALLCTLLALSILDPIKARTTFNSRHSYPKSGGHSGGGSHSYPKSGGLSGSGGGSHGYPSSSGLSGSGGSGYPSSSGTHSYPTSGGSHNYPSSGGSHSYPASGGLSGNSGGRGYPSAVGSHSYPSSGGSHSYPQSGGSHSYPQSGGSHNNHGYPTSGQFYGNNNRGPISTTHVHHHYHYSPPPSITYTPIHGGPPVSYPVYRSTPPTYVYQYKDSGSKYGTLLAGLALLNLGTLAAGTAYAVSHSHSHSQYNSPYTYKTQPGEICKFGLKKDNGDYEETRIDCQLISSFILAEQAKQTPQQHNSSTVTTTTVTNVTTINDTNPVQSTVQQQTTKTLYEMLPNGTLIPVNVPVNTTNDAAADAKNMMTSSVVTTITTVTNALDVKGSPVDVTPSMQCFVIRSTSTSNMRKTVPCQVLQSYADKSIQRNSANQNLHSIVTLTVVVAVMVVNLGI